MRRRLQRGFTLIELLVVISIIGILVGVGAAAYTNAQQKSRNARRRADLKAVQDGFEQYYSTVGNNSYAACGTMFAATSIFPAGAAPTDPKGIAPYTYRFTCDAAASTYCICAALEGGEAGNATNNNCSMGVGNYYCLKHLQ